MKIALLGGNAYQYASAPSYVHANGKGYITGNQLLGATASAVTITPEMALEMEAEYKAAGQPVPANIKALADQYRSEAKWNFAGRLVSLAEKGLDTLTGKQTTTDTDAQARDNTALIVTGMVAGVAVLAVIMSTKKKR